MRHEVDGRGEEIAGGIMIGTDAALRGVIMDTGVAGGKILKKNPWKSNEFFVFFYLFFKPNFLALFFVFL